MALGWATSATACDVVPTPATGPISSIAITCGPGQDQTIDEPFVDALDFDYDGSGNDSLTVNGATLTIRQNTTTPYGPFAIEFLGGNDTFTMSSGGIFRDPTDPTAPELFMDLGDGNDVVNISGGAFGGDIYLGAGDNSVTMSGGSAVTFEGEEGTDTFNMSGGSVAVQLFGRDGNDTFRISGNAVIGSGYDQRGTDARAYGIVGGNGDDLIEISGGVVGEVTADGGSVSTGAIFSGRDTVRLLGGAVTRSLRTGLDDDRVEISAGTIGTDVATGDGADIISISGGSIGGSVFAGLGNDTVTMSGGSVAGRIEGEDGDDTVVMTGGFVGSSIELGDGNNTITMSGGQVFEAIRGGVGATVFNISGTAMISAPANRDHIAPGVDGNSGNDIFNMSGGAVYSDIFLAGGDDQFNMSGGSVWWLSGDFGDDTFDISGTAVIGANVPNGVFSGGSAYVGGIFGEDGHDTVTIRGGTITGAIGAETVNLYGGTLNGVMFDLSNTTLTIDDGADTSQLVRLNDGYGFFGDNAVGTISRTDLAASGSQFFEGFASLSILNGSTLRLLSVPQTIDALFVSGGSTLFVPGTLALIDGSGNPSSLTVQDGLIDLRNGSADSVLNVGTLTLNNGTVAIDVDQGTARADQIFAGATNATGQNIIQVALVGTPNFAGQTDIPILATAGLDTSTFQAAGLAGSAASLFDFALVDGGAAGLLLRVTPNNVAPSLTTQTAIDSRPIEVAADTLTDVTTQAADSGLGLSGGGARTQITPTFGVFSSGHFGQTHHGGFTVIGSGIEALGPEFTSNDFSAALSFDFDAARHFQVDQSYGINLGVFGGYTSSDVDLGAFAGFPTVGNAKNESGLFGAYGLFRRELNYLLISATGFVGQTEIANQVLLSTATYDTHGYAATASVGHIFMLGERYRFDLRGGLLGATFTGDGYTDSEGNVFSDAGTSFGAVRFEPGIYAEFKMDNGLVFNPYARLTLQQRFGYENTGRIGAQDFEFKDADFSASFATGFNVKTSQRLTFSSEVSGKLSGDSSTIAGKAGLKIAF